MKLFSTLYVTIFNIGNFPFAPGTLGSLFSYIILFFLFNLFDNIIALSLIFLIIFIISIYIINIYINITKKNDPKEVIIDEFLGCFLIYLFIFNFNNLLYFLILSFIIFRFFDIYKIYPINIIQNKIKNSYGIIFDDIFAAIYTIIILKVINEYFI